jgi:hypothetical protein
MIILLSLHGVLTIWWLQKILSTYIFVFWIVVSTVAGKKKLDII